MRLALKIAYFGAGFYGHQRQPNVRTVEGECLRALKAARIFRDPAESFFRSASRTDRGVSAIGNVIAFDSRMPSEAVLGAFNDRVRDVWAWAVAEVPDAFHPRHARERWYRYHLADPPPLDALRKAGAAFVGQHDLRSFTSDPPQGLVTIRAVSVAPDDGVALIDVRAPSFRRGMIRRIVAAMLGRARGEIAEDELLASLEGKKRDFGAVPPEPLVLMDVTYDFAFRTILKPKVRDEWRAWSIRADLPIRFLRAFQEAAFVEPAAERNESPKSRNE